MFLLRLGGLLLLTAFCFAMGQVPSNEANALGRFGAALFFVVAPLAYFLPTIEAKLNNHTSVASLGLLNLFLGWTFIGWVAAYIWAFKKPAEVVIAAPTAQPIAETDPAPPQKETKRCPFCAEDILAAAIKCKHCGSALA